MGFLATAEGSFNINEHVCVSSVCAGMAGSLTSRQPDMMRSRHEEQKLVWSVRSYAELQAVQCKDSARRELV